MIDHELHSPFAYLTELVTDLRTTCPNGRGSKTVRLPQFVGPSTTYRWAVFLYIRKGRKLGPGLDVARGAWLVGVFVGDSQRAIDDL